MFFREFLKNFQNNFSSEQFRTISSEVINPFMHNVVKWPDIRFLKYVWPFYNIMHERIQMFNALLYFEVAAATCKRSHLEVFCKKAVVYKMRLQAQKLPKTNFLKLVKMLNLK